MCAPIIYENTPGHLATVDIFQFFNYFNMFLFFLFFLGLTAG